MSDNRTQYSSCIWNDEAEAENPFAAKASFCSGYNVYRDLLGKASWSDYLFLMYRQERPEPEQSQLLHALAVVLAHPGLRDHSVLAAMNAGVGGSTAAACLIAALGVGAGQLYGAHDVFLAMEIWQRCGKNINKWREDISHPPESEITDIWEPLEHIAGFDPNCDFTPGVVKDALAHLATLSNNGPVAWMRDHLEQLERFTDCGLAFSGLAAGCLHELGFSPEQGEMLYLLLRLPGAGAQALEQKHYGWRRFPFYPDGLTLLDTGAPAGKQGHANREVENEQS